MICIQDEIILGVACTGGTGTGLSNNIVGQEYAYEVL